MPKPKRSFWAPPRPKNDPIGPQKAEMTKRIKNSEKKKNYKLKFISVYG